jgi:hypothetical protein
VKGLQVVPYLPGTPVYQDGVLAELYRRLRLENKVELTFCGENKSMDDFISYFHRIKLIQVLCTVDEDGTLHPAGFSWVDNIRGPEGRRVAMPGEAFFKGSERVSRTLAKLSLAYVMHEMRISVFHGVQCVSNYPARNFAIRCGFKECAQIPKYHLVNGEWEDARIMILEAKDYLPGFWKWKEAIDQEQKPVEANS